VNIYEVLQTLIVDIKGTKFEGNVYLVGGIVRDFIMDGNFNNVKDIDVIAREKLKTIRIVHLKGQGSKIQNIHKVIPDRYEGQKNIAKKALKFMMEEGQGNKKN
jgi:tRNA nucleotidyltransferase/poly(A) polymerase